MDQWFTANCTFCQMTGTVRDQICKQCGGTGKTAIFLPAIKCPKCDGGETSPGNRCDLCSGYAAIPLWRPKE